MNEQDEKLCERLQERGAHPHEFRAGHRIAELTSDNEQLKLIADFHLESVRALEAENERKDREIERLRAALKEIKEHHIGLNLIARRPVERSHTLAIIFAALAEKEKKS